MLERVLRCTISKNTSCSPAHLSGIVDQSPSAVDFFSDTTLLVVGGVLSGEWSSDASTGRCLW